MKTKTVIVALLFIVNLLYPQQGEVIAPPGGRVRTLAVNPLQPNTVFAGTEDNILFKSTDAGETSAAIFDSSGFFPFSSSRISFDPTNSAILYAGNYKSEDGGDTWKRLNGFGSSLAINPLRPEKMYTAAFGKELRVSENGGESWLLLYEFKISLEIIAVSSADTSILYAAGADSLYGIYISGNSGISWQRTDFPTGYYHIKSIIISPYNSQTVWVGTSSGILKTTDSGQTWSLLSGEGINDMVICPQDTNVIYFVTGDYYTGTAGDVYKTTDGGTTWEIVNKGLPQDNSRFIYHIEINPAEPNELYIGTYGYGVYKTINGGTEWQWTALTKAPVLSLSFHPSMEGYIYAGTYDEGIMYTTDAGTTWGQLALGLPVTGQTFCRQIRFNPFDNNIAYATAGPYGVLKSTDGGWTWQQTSLTGSFDTWAWSLAIHPVHSDTVYCGQTGWAGRDLYRSTDAGATWNNLLLFGNAGRVDNILFDELAPDHIYLCVSELGFYKSTDNGQTWEQANDGLKTSDYPLVSAVRSVSIGETSNILYLVQKNGVRKSTDYGDSWFSIDSTLALVDSNFVAWDVSLHPHNSNILLAGLESGVWLTSNNGVSWKRIFSGSSSEVQFDPHNSTKLYISTKAGIYIIPDTLNSSMEIPVEPLPSDVVLYQNYPNPFNSSTIITYWLAIHSLVHIDVYNDVGQKVKTLVSGMRGPGQYSVVWDGTDHFGNAMSSGIYISTLKSSDFIHSNKLLLVK